MEEIKNNSCRGCKFLYADGSGYSNYTWLDTYLRCALDKNPNLKGDIEEPYGWDKDGQDVWEKTCNSRCEMFSNGVFVILDPEREDKISSQSTDVEQIEAISKHSGEQP